jgi:hypothetical protein
MQRKERLEKFKLKVKSIFRSKKKKAWNFQATECWQITT